MLAHRQKAGGAVSPQSVPLPLEPPFTVAVIAELTGLSVKRIHNLLCLHRDEFPIRRYRRGRHRKALRVRWFTGEEVRLIASLANNTWEGKREK